MILDAGICTVFRETDVSAPGDMPVKGYTPIYASWYGELNFSSTPEWQTEGRKEQKVDRKIRITQKRDIRQNDVVVLEHIASFAEKSAGADVFRVVRAYHGQDDDSPAQISDLSLEVHKP